MMRRFSSSSSSSFLKPQLLRQNWCLLRFCSSSSSNPPPDFQEILHFSDFTRQFLKDNKLDTVSAIESLTKAQINEIIAPYYKPKDQVSSLEDANIRTFSLFTQVVKMTKTDENNNNDEGKEKESDAKNNKELKYFLFASAEQGEALALRCAIATGRLGGPAEISALRDETAGRRSVLFIACLRGHVECVKTLIELGIEVGGDDQASSGYSCLRIACEKNHAEIVNLLLRAGANPNSSINNNNDNKNDQLLLPIHVVASQGFHELIEPLVKIGKANVNQLYIKSTSSSNNKINDNPLIVDPLVLATQQGHLQTVVALLENGADATFIATVPNHSEQHKSEFVKALLQDNHDDKEGSLPSSSRNNKIQQRTALSIACDLGYTDIVRAFLTSPVLSMGTKIALLNDQREFASRPDLCTPLCSAVTNGHVNVVREILAFAHENKVSPFECKNLTQADGATPLFIACQYGYAEIAAMLIKSGGVDPNIPLNPNVTRRNMTMMKNMKNIIDDDVTTTMMYPTPLGIAIQEKHYQIVQILLRHAAETGLKKEFTMVSAGHQQKDDEKNSSSSLLAPSPVFVAAANNDAETVQLLIDFNCDAERPNDAGLTPIAVAVHNGYRDVVRVLLRAGVSIDFEMGKFKSLGQLALHKGHAEIFQMLTHHERTPAESAKQERDKQKKIAKKMWQM